VGNDSHLAGTRPIWSAFRGGRRRGRAIDSRNTRSAGFDYDPCPGRDVDVAGPVVDGSNAITIAVNWTCPVLRRRDGPSIVVDRDIAIFARLSECAANDQALPPIAPGGVAGA